MNINVWRYYHHAFIPRLPPNEKPNLTSIIDNSIWKSNKKALFAEWTTDFDCKYKTDWWYVIIDKPFDLSEIKSKRRYEINKGIKNFIIKEINPKQYLEELFDIQKNAFSVYPKKYRPKLNHNIFIEEVKHWDFYKVYGAFNIENKCLCGYSILTKEKNFINFNVLKTIPKYESKGINAALCYKIVEEHKEFLLNGGIICDGSRNVVHETNFQNYLEKYFNFRKAFCNLNIKYRPKIDLIVNCLFPLKNIFKMLDSINIFHQINGLLKLEEIKRKCNNN